MSLLTKALPCKHELNKYFLKNNEKKNGGTLARTAPHAQGLGQQYCRLKEMQGQTENSLVNTAGLNTVVHFRKKNIRQGKPRNAADGPFIVTSQQTGIHISLFFVYQAEKRVTFYLHALFVLFSFSCSIISDSIAGTSQMPDKGN